MEPGGLSSFLQNLKTATGQGVSELNKLDQKLKSVGGRYTENLQGIAAQIQESLDEIESLKKRTDELVGGKKNNTINQTAAREDVPVGRLEKERSTANKKIKEQQTKLIGLTKDFEEGLKEVLKAVVDDLEAERKKFDRVMNELGVARARTIREGYLGTNAQQALAQGRETLGQYKSDPNSVDFDNQITALIKAITSLEKAVKVADDRQKKRGEKFYEENVVSPRMAGYNYNTARRQMDQSLRKRDYDNQPEKVAERNRLKRIEQEKTIIRTIKEKIRAGEKLSANEQKLIRNAQEQARAGQFTNSIYRKLSASLRLNTKDLKINNDVVQQQQKSYTNIIAVLSRYRNILLVTMFAIRPMINFMKESVQVAIRYEKAMQGSTAVGRRFGIQSDKMTASIKKLTKDGLLSVAEAGTGLKNLLSSGLNLEQATKLMDTFTNSAALNRQGQLELGQAVVGATDGFKNMMPRMIDNAGITKNVNEIIKEQAALRGINTATLDEAAKKQLLYQGIVKEGLVFQGDASIALQTTDGKLQQLSKSFELFQVVLGNIPKTLGLDTVISELDSLLKQLTIAFDFRKEYEKATELGAGLGADPETLKMINSLRDAQQIQKALRDNSDFGPSISKNAFEQRGNSSTRYSAVAGAAPVTANRQINVSDKFRSMVEGQYSGEKSIAENLNQRRKDLFENLIFSSDMDTDERKEYLGPVVEDYIERLNNDLKVIEGGYKLLLSKAVDEGLPAGAVDELTKARLRAQTQIAEKLNEVLKLDFYKEFLSDKQASNIAQSEEERNKKLAENKLAEQQQQFTDLALRIDRYASKASESGLERALQNNTNSNNEINNKLKKALDDDKINQEQFDKLVAQLKQSQTLNAEQITQEFQDKAVSSFLSFTSATFKSRADLDQEIKGLRLGLANKLESYGKLQGEEKDAVVQAMVKQLDLASNSTWQDVEHVLKKQLEERIDELKQADFIDSLRKKLADARKDIAQEISLNKSNLRLLERQNEAEATALSSADRSTFDEQGLEKRFAKERELIKKNSESQIAATNSNIKVYEEEIATLEKQTQTEFEKNEIKRLGNLLAIENNNLLEHQADLQIALNNLDQKAVDQYKEELERLRLKEVTLGDIGSSILRLGSSIKRFDSESTDKWARHTRNVGNSIVAVHSLIDAYKDLKLAQGTQGASLVNPTIGLITTALTVASSVAAIFSDNKNEDEKRRSRKERRQAELGATINRGPNTININPSIVVSAEGDVLFSQDSIEVIRTQLIDQVQRSYEFGELTPTDQNY